MTHTLLLIILSLFLTDVSSEATTLRTYPEGRTLSYTDDGALLRAETWTGNLTHQWLYHGPLTPIAQLDNQGQVVARYVYGSQDRVPDYPLLGEAIYRLVTDHLGSVRLVVDVMTGEVVQRLDYDVWGNVLQDTNPGFQPFGFAGGMSDSLTGLVHFGTRDYDPSVGRWTTKDPIGFASEDTNLYAYVYNDPVNSVDPSGLFLNLVAGCLISGGIELASQMIIDGKSLGCVDWGSVALETATGCGGGSIVSKLWKSAKDLATSALPCANSLVTGTLVHTETGLKPIQEIPIGEKVLSFDERTEQTSYQPVLGIVSKHQKYQLVKITLDSGESLEATAGHPFYVPGKGWNAAGNLKVGEALRLQNGITVVIKEVDTSVRTEIVYNFTVANYHNYFVGRDGVLVHNINWSPKSVKTFGHTFSRHGAGAKNTKNLVGRAASTGDNQGQWKNNETAAEFLRESADKLSGPATVQIPDGLGQVITPDGTIVPTNWANLVPCGDGYKTAYPVFPKK